MAFDAFMKITGVDGESTRQGFEKQIELYSFSWGASNPVNVAGSGMAAGKVSISSFNVMKKTDAASPKLFLYCCSGKHFDSATVTLNKAAGDKPINYITYDFKEIFVESIQWSGSSGGDDTPAESVSFTFGEVKITYIPQDDKGTKGSPISQGWSVKKTAALG